MSSRDKAFLALFVVWCGLWAFILVRAARQKRRIPVSDWKPVLQFIAMGFFFWSNGSPSIRQRYPFVPWLAFLGWGYFIWPTIRDQLLGKDTRAPKAEPESRDQ